MTRFTENFRKPAPGKSIAETYPNLLNEWDWEKNGNLHPKEISYGVSSPLWWKCLAHGHSWRVSVKERAKGSGCSVCSNRIILPGFNDIATTHPHLVSEWNQEENGELTPWNVGAGSHTVIAWKCSKGHTWKINPLARTLKETGCAYCARIKVMPGETDFATLYPELVHRFDTKKNTTPLNEVAPNARKKYWWKCELGHSVQVSPAGIISSPRACQVCSNRKALKGFNDLVTKEPELASEFDEVKNNIQADEIIFTTSKKYWWKCNKNGHSWNASVVNRQRLRADCPFCSNQQLLKGFNDIATMRPAIAAELNEPGLNASDVIFGSNKLMNWKCSQGHEWEASVSQRVHNNSACMICSKSNTSTIETELRKRLINSTILLNIKQNDNHVLKIAWRTKKSMRVDIVGELKNGQKVVIEYDSFYYHQNKLQIDTDKTNALLKAGYVVLRLRERKLVSTGVNNKNYIEILDIKLNTSNMFDKAMEEIELALSR